jgi:hypothetical protein
VTVVDVDALVLGATLRGLVAARTLRAQGLTVALVERSSVLGGADGSFRTAAGNGFDHGLHVIDADRAPTVTQLFTEVLGGDVVRTELRRGIVLRGQVMPYAPAPDDMPAAVRALLRPGPLVDDIGDDLPTRARLAACYGTAYADLVLDEVLPSFPSEYRHHAFGVDESRLLANVYPWFFPRVERRAATNDESRAFHDRLRAGVPQVVLYPRDGGFGGFAAALAAGLERDGVEVVLGASDLHVEVERATHRITHVDAAGRRFRAGTYYWGAGWAALCERLGIGCQDVATDQVVLGSFRFDRPVPTDFHELLVGDPSLLLNRVHRPSAFRHDDTPLLQVEFAYPALDDTWARDPDAWRDRWLADLRALGLLDGSHRVDDFDFRAFRMHFNGYGAEGVALRDADPTLLAPGSNVVPLAPSMANLNINRYVERVIADASASVRAS